MTRIAVISDVHANVHALRAVLAALDESGVSRFLFAGDVVGYGPHPNECVEVLQGLPAVAVAGNHDLVAIGRADLGRCGRLARQTLEWTMGQLTEAAQDYLDSLPVIHSEGEVVMTHGSLTDRFQYIRSAEQAAGQLVQLSTAHPEARVLLLGHTHLPMAYSSDDGMLDIREARVALHPGQRHVLNPGSVGQSRDRSPDASCMILDLEAGEASFLRIPYDIAACRADLRMQGLPVEGCHRKPVSSSLHHRVGRRVKRVVLGRGGGTGSAGQSR